MLVKLRISLALCTFLGLPGMASAEAPPPVTVKDEDAFSDLTPYQRDRIQVMEGNTIWSIARVNRPQSATIEQMVLGLYFSNPEAFAEHNISRLKAGSQLIVPPAILFAQISPVDAKELLRKLRSGASYDAGKILHFKQSGQTSPRHPDKNVPPMPATSSTGSTAPSTDNTKSTPVTEIHTTQPSTQQEAVPPVQPEKQEAAAPALPHEAAVQIEQHTAESHATPAQQDAEKITAAAPAPVSAVEATAPTMPAAEVKTATPPVPCATEDCRLALSREAEERLIEIQKEIKQLNAILVPQQRAPVALSVANENETAPNEPPGKNTDAAAPATGPNALLKAWETLKAQDPLTLASFAAIAVLLEMAVRALLKLSRNLRNRAATTATSPDTEAKSGQDSASATPEAKPHSIEPSPGRFKTVVLSSDDELSPYADIPEPDYAKAASAGEKHQEYSPYLDDKSVIKANRIPASYDTAQNSAPLPPGTSVVPEWPTPKKPVPAVDHNSYMDDDLGLDFGLQDDKQDSKR